MPQNNFYSSLQQSAPYRKFFGRLDYDITQNHRLTMSDTQSDTPQMYPSNSVLPVPSVARAGDVDNNNAQITEVWNISPRTINEARIGFTSQLNFFKDLALNKGYASQLGWQFAKADDFPAINFTGGSYPYAWIDPSSNSVYKEFTWDPSDVVTMIRGKHILHFGGELLAYQNNSTAWGNTNAGTFSVLGPVHPAVGTRRRTALPRPVAGTGMEYADFLLGYAQQWNAGLSPEYGARLKTPQVFVQDDWKVRPNLTAESWSSLPDQPWLERGQEQYVQLRPNRGEPGEQYAGRLLVRSHPRQRSHLPAGQYVQHVAAALRSSLGYRSQDHPPRRIWRLLLHLEPGYLRRKQYELRNGRRG